MLRWLLYVPFSFLTMFICYFLNPIVLLFCDKHGELHGFLHYFQTWDDSCNPRCAVMEMAPKCIRYDWDKHYTERRVDDSPELVGTGRSRYVATCINDDFTREEKIKRYLCRVYWLTRNCAYGFAFWWYGCTYDPSKLVVKYKENSSYGYEEGNICTRPFTYKNSNRIFGTFYWNIFLGWKIDYGKYQPNRVMIAHRIAIKTHPDY